MTPPRWQELTQPQQLEFLLGGKIGLEEWYIDSTTESGQEWSAKDIEEFRARIKNREVYYYGETDKWLYEALEMVPIKGVEVAVMGSVLPWYETIISEFGGEPFTIEYNLPNYPGFKGITVDEYWKNPRQSDMAWSISSFEHDGLGRYGDPLNPSGDFRAMSEMKKILKPGGILFLAVPVGLDKVVWNAHRIYGNIRFPMLIDGWTLEGCVGMDEDLMARDTGQSGFYQPIVMLRNT